jgi:hypothetical protein
VKSFLGGRGRLFGRAATFLGGVPTLSTQSEDGLAATTVGRMRVMIAMKLAPARMDYPTIGFTVFSAA